MPRAIRLSQYGGPHVLDWVNINLPDVLAGDELRIKVLAAGLNPIDAKIRAGTNFVCKALALPTGLGFDLCGKILAMGDAVDNFRVGDVVMGSVGCYHDPKAYSEQCIVKVNEIIAKPSKLSPEQAAAMPIASVTAWQALYLHGNVQSNQRVLIHAAAGGVGHIAVQLAKLAGAYVICTASERNHEYLASLGADEIIDYHKQVFEKVVAPVDLVIDLVGGETGIRSFRVLKSTGLLVTVPSITHELVLNAAKEQEVNAVSMIVDVNADDLAHLGKLAADSDLDIKIADRFAMHDAASAHELLEQGGFHGKLVLVA